MTEETWNPPRQPASIQVLGSTVRQMDHQSGTSVNPPYRKATSQTTSGWKKRCKRKRNNPHTHLLRSAEKGGMQKEAPKKSRFSSASYLRFDLDLHLLPSSFCGFLLVLGCGVLGINLGLSESMT